MFTDVAAILGASALVAALAGDIYELTLTQVFGAFAFLAVLTFMVWAGLAALAGLYRRDEQRADLTLTDDIVPVTVLTTLVVWVLTVASTLLDSTVPTGVYVGLWAAMTALVLVGRAGTRTLVRGRARYEQRTLIVGAGDVGQLLGRKLAQHPEFGLRLVGFVDDDPKSMRRDLSDVPVLGTPSEIGALVTTHDIQRVVVAFSNERHDRLLELVHALHDLDVQIDLVPRLFEAIGPTFGIQYIEGLPLVVLSSRRPTRIARVAKRGMDILGSALALILLSPVFVFIAWRVKRTSHGPVFFRQERLGQGMRRFEMLKFRTMRNDTDAAPHREYVQTIMDTKQSPAEGNLYKLNRGEAVTSTGLWLRRTSLDELPQLINVLRGNMSLVGPRPCMEYECDLFEPHHFDRFLVPAGMTGLWQVTARARSTLKEALDLDVAYARNWSLGLDLKLMLRTPLALFRTGETT